MQNIALQSRSEQSIAGLGRLEKGKAEQIRAEHSKAEWRSANKEEQSSEK